MRARRNVGMPGVGARAALYLRRSKDKQEASVEVQRSEALAYCESKGWLVAEQMVFIDDDHSRAEFKKRPALIQMLNAAKDGRFDVVVVRDDSRLGGDTYRTGMVIQDLIDNGTQLVYYYTDEHVQLASAVDKFLIAARNFASELEREKISQRTHEHLLNKAKQGRPAGGIAFGYQIAEDERGFREYQIKENEAAVVRRMFEMYAKGMGFRSIASTLNREGVKSPRAGKRGTGSWSPSSVRGVLKNPRYIGAAPYNQTEKTYKGGTKVRLQRPESEHIQYETPRIVSDDVWTEVAQRFEGNKPFGGAKAGKGRRNKYLLSGIGRCGVCGGPMQVCNARQGRQNIRVYGCRWRKDRGASVCSNSLHQPVERVDAFVVGYLRHHILTERVVEEICGVVRERLQDRQQHVPDELAAMRAEADAVRREVANLTSALASAAAQPVAVLKAIGEREEKLTQLEARIGTLEASMNIVEDELGNLEAEARDRIERLAEVLADVPTEARSFLEDLAPDGLQFEPVQRANGPRYRVHGRLAVQDALFAVDVDHEAEDSVPKGRKSRKTKKIVRDLRPCGVPSGIRTRVAGVKGRCPGPD